MNKEPFEGDVIHGHAVLYHGKPVKIISRNDKNITIQLGRKHFMTVLPYEVELELIDGYGVETR